jgi:uncharacterized cupredoxin-like copper-binding protein
MARSLIIVASALLLAACSTNRPPAAAVAAGVPATVVRVALVDYRFEPGELVLEQGKSYRLELRNSGTATHEFAAPAFFTAAHIADRAMLTHEGTEILLQPGQAHAIELVAPGPGSYRLTCPDHDWDGMVGKITVR